MGQTMHYSRINHIPSSCRWQEFRANSIGANGSPGVTGPGLVHIELDRVTAKKALRTRLTGHTGALRTDLQRGGAHTGPSH